MPPQRRLHGFGEAVGNVRVGHVQTHPTHTLLHARGLWWCTSCGAYATARLGAKSSAKLLVAQCIRTPTRAGRDYLARLGRGLPPKAGMRWPCP